jgi:pimeloyl-ACP methyl ester carboxylesterase
VRPLVSILLVLALAACGANDSPDPEPDLIIEPGHLSGIELAPGTHDVFVGPESDRMRMALVVPDPVPVADVPLVLALHWYDPRAVQPGKDFVRLLVEPALGDLGGIIVAPVVWKDRWNRRDVARTLKSLVDSALEVWPVDPDRVVVTGYSMGGMGAWHLASLYPRTFSATIPMAGEPGGVLEPMVPVYAIHGDEDELFDIAVTREAVEELVRRGGIAELVVAEGLSHYQGAAYVPYLAGAVVWLNEVVW